MSGAAVPWARRLAFAGQWWVPGLALAWVVVATTVYQPWAGAGHLLASPALWLVLVVPVLVARRRGGVRSPRTVTAAYAATTIGVWVAVVAYGLGYWFAIDPDPTRLRSARAVPVLAALVLVVWCAQLAAAIRSGQRARARTAGDITRGDGT